MQQQRKIYLTNVCRILLVNTKGKVHGTASLAQLMLNRIESVSKTNDEYRYMVDVAAEMIRQTAGKEIEVYYKGKLVEREQLTELLNILDLEFNNSLKHDDYEIEMK